MPTSKNPSHRQITTIKFTSTYQEKRDREEKTPSQNVEGFTIKHKTLNNSSIRSHNLHLFKIPFFVYPIHTPSTQGIQDRIGFRDAIATTTSHIHATQSIIHRQIIIHACMPYPASFSFISSPFLTPNFSIANTTTISPPIHHTTPQTDRQISRERRK